MPRLRSVSPHTASPRRLLGALLVGALSLSSLACGPGYVTGTRIEYTPQRQELAELVERYRVAMEQRDTDALRAMVSRNYYENGSTTNDPSDDYDYRGLQRLLGDLQNTVEAVKYHIEINDIKVLQGAAYVDLEYQAEYRIKVAGEGKWATANDRNRITFEREDDRWLIVSGL